MAAPCRACIRSRSLLQYKSPNLQRAGPSWLCKCMNPTAAHYKEIAMRKGFLVLISTIFSMTLLVPILHAEGPKKEKQKHESGVIFRPEDRTIINEYFRVNTSNLPPGLAKRGGNLPPGLQKQLRRNGQLPPGLQERLEPLPVELERRLPPLPPGCGCNRGVLGANVVLVRTRDQLILDALRLTGR